MENKKVDVILALVVLDFGLEFNTIMFANLANNVGERCVYEVPVYIEMFRCVIVRCYLFNKWLVEFCK